MGSLLIRRVRLEFEPTSQQQAGGISRLNKLVFPFLILLTSRACCNGICLDFTLFWFSGRLCKYGVEALLDGGYVKHVHTHTESK